MDWCGCDISAEETCACHLLLNFSLEQQLGGWRENYLGGYGANLFSLPDIPEQLEQFPPISQNRRNPVRSRVVRTIIDERHSQALHVVNLLPVALVPAVRFVVAGYD